MFIRTKNSLKKVLKLRKKKHFLKSIVFFCFCRVVRVVNLPQKCILLLTALWLCRSFIHCVTVTVTVVFVVLFFFFNSLWSSTSRHCLISLRKKRKFIINSSCQILKHFFGRLFKLIFSLLRKIRKISEKFDKKCFVVLHLFERLETNCAWFCFFFIVCEG